MLDRPDRSAEATARETTERWIGAFNAALAGGRPAVLSELLVEDCHWRNLFGLSWYFATFSGNATVTAELLARAAEVRAAHFRIDQAALAPRHAVVEFDLDADVVAAVDIAAAAAGTTRTEYVAAALRAALSRGPQVE